MTTKNLKNKANYIFFLIVIFMIITLGVIKLTPTPTPKLKAITIPDKIYVERVVDGDTFVDKEKRRYRLIGVDTPELKRGNQLAEPYAIEAKEYAKKLLEHKLVRLQYDNEKYDRYKRLLVYVYLPDGKMFNRLLLKNGYAEVYRKASYKHKQEFYKLQNDARKKEIGIWNNKHLN